MAVRFDSVLRTRGWATANIDMETHNDGQLIAAVRSHQIDMFKKGPGRSFPGVACEFEWNNKDPFFDRDLSNFYTLHRAAAVAVGIVVTRSATLQIFLRTLPAAVARKYGASTNGSPKQ